MPKVSIIVPVYNVEPYLRESLDSVINQTLNDIEVICVDDCSTDGSFAILEEYAKRDERFVILKQDVNQGQGVARNKGLDIAKGDYIMFLDPDDWYELDACESAYNQITKNGNDFCIFSYNTFVQETGELVPNTSKLKPFENADNADYINLREFNEYFYQNSFTFTQIYDKNFINSNNIRFSPGRNAEDIAFMTQIVINSSSMSVCFKHLYNYRKLKNSTSRKYNKMWLETTFASRKEAYEAYLKDGNENILKAYVKYYIKSLLHWWQQIYVEDVKIKRDFYTKMRKVFLYLDKRYMNDELRLKIGPRPTRLEYAEILKRTYCGYKWDEFYEKHKAFFENIFSIKNVDGGNYKQFTIAGLKMKFAKKNTKNRAV